MTHARRIAATLLPVLSLAASALPGRARQSTADDAFESRVRPVLVARCQSCHGASLQSGGIRLDTAQGARAAAGKLAAALDWNHSLKMPPAGKLPPADLQALSAWARAGAPWPKATGKPNALPWAFGPLPAGRAGSLDAFIRARLAQAGLRPAAPADKRTLLRRVSFDLTGLPPTPEEMASFLADAKPGAYERVVERLLASPAYGERWARHWLDVVRYCDSLDSRGLGGEGDIADAWRYRDWVIDALNADMPYDRFMLQQVAGDLLTTPDGDVDVAATIATGFLAIGNWGNGDADKDKILTDIADDQVDTVGKAFLGLTVGCARCHDHKFDPISTRDYYALAGIFFSTHILPKLTPKGAGEIPLRIALTTKAERTDRERLRIAEGELDAYRSAQRAELARRLAPEAGRYLAALRDGRTEGLAPWALRRWKEGLGLSGYPLMTVPVHSVADNAGVDGVRGGNDTPNQLVNANDTERKILTFTLPPRSVAVHPGPRNGVVVGWVSPIDGVVQIAGKVADADPACGDGAQWRVDRRTASGTQTLASGGFGNGGADTVAGEKLKTVPIRRGESVELLVLPGGEYSCDTTVVELTITAADGARWNLTEDTLRAPGRNPLPDSRGNSGVWRFADMAGGAAGTLPDAVRAAWVAGDAEKAAAAAVALPPDQSPFAPDADSDFPDPVRAELARRQDELATIRKRIPAMMQYANGAQDGGVPESPHAGVHDVRVHQRGRYDRLGDLVPRGVPTILASVCGPIVIEKGSGRLELGRWLGNPKNPLPARVIVNRLWQGHFGQGIVATSSNFGAMGEKPTHPELLDWLASELIRSGWSLKHIHRLIVTSQTYRQSDHATPEALRKDPENRLLGRMSRRRLEAEALRDSLLTAAGRLDRAPGGPAVRDIAVPRRSVYLMSVRSDRTGFGPLFDMPDSTNSIERRTNSVVAPQALYLLNADFVLAQAKSLAARLQREAPTDAARIDRAYRLLYARPATDSERAVGLKFLTAAPSGRGWEEYAQVLLCANEFVFVD